MYQLDLIKIVDFFINSQFLGQYNFLLPIPYNLNVTLKDNDYNHVFNFVSLFQLRSIRSWSWEHKFAKVCSTTFPQIWTVSSSFEISTAVERQGIGSQNIHGLQGSDFAKTTGIHARKVSQMYIYITISTYTSVHPFPKTSSN